MAAKQSAEMREALRLVQSGQTVTAAAAAAGVRRESLHAAIKKIRDEAAKSLQST